MELSGPDGGVSASRVTEQGGLAVGELLVVDDGADTVEDNLALGAAGDERVGWAWRVGGKTGC